MNFFLDVLTRAVRAGRSHRGAQLTQPLSEGFWTGRQFRMYREFTLGNGASTTLRITATKPFLLTDQNLTITAGDARAVIRVGATPAGDWTDITTVNPKFRIGMEPVSTLSVAAGGTITGGTEREAIIAAAGTGGSVHRALGSAGIAGARGLPATTFYITITAGSNGATGLYAIEWEDLD